MKSEIFENAIFNRNQIRFLYGLNEIVLDPYFIGRESGRKVIYGKLLNSSEIRKFKFYKIANIKIIGRIRFTPLIPIIPHIN